jgi:hypothetical protein
VSALGITDKMTINEVVAAAIEPVHNQNQFRLLPRLICVIRFSEQALRLSWTMSRKSAVLVSSMLAMKTVAETKKVPAIRGPVN